MKKVIRLTESDLKNIISKVLQEQTNKEDINPKKLKIGSGGKYDSKNVEDVKKLQKKLMDSGFLVTKSMVPTGYFGPLTQNALDRYFGKPSQNAQPKTNAPQKNAEVTQQGEPCPSVVNSPYFRDLNTMIAEWQKKYPNFKTRQEIISFIDRMINRDAQSYKTSVKNISSQAACQAASIGRRSQYDTKNVFIVDSPNKRIYLFAPSSGDGVRKLIVQDIIQDGKNKQRNDAVSVANTFVNYEQKFKNLKNKLKRDPTSDEVWAEYDKTQSRFLPAGIYQGTSARKEKDYAGGEGINLLHLKNWLGDNVSQAIHGYAKGDNRVSFMQRAMQIVKNPNDPKQIQQFMDEMKNNGLKMDFSYGCINVPPRFAKYLEKYGPNSFIFNIAEDNQNYLVQNTINYFDKQEKSESCLSPQALGAVDLSTMA